MGTASTTPPAQLGAGWASSIRRAIGWRRTADLTVWPLFDLALRILLAQPFLASGLLKLSAWDQAIFLATNEYPVSWAGPETAAILGVGIELGAGVLLALGLFARFAGAALGALALAIQFTYLPLDLHIHWTMLAFWFVLAGAGPISLDALFRRGLGDAPLPLAQWIAGVFGLMKSKAAPIALLAIRIWLGWIFLHAGLAHIDVAPLLGGLECALAAFVVLGLVGRLTALALIALTLLAPFTAMQAPDALWLIMMLGLIAARGPGRISADALIEARLAQRLPTIFDRDVWRAERLPHVVVVGAGFGGVAAARALGDAPCRVTVIDRHNYHLFQPLLYQVATAGLSPSDIATPIRELFRGQPNARVMMGRVDAVDHAALEYFVRIFCVV